MPNPMTEAKREILRTTLSEAQNSRRAQIELNPDKKTNNTDKTKSKPSINKTPTSTLTFGGGIQKLRDAESVISMGFEKISFNSQCLRNPILVTQSIKNLGAQAVVCSIDYGWHRGEYRVFDHLSRKFIETNLREFFLQCIDLGCGELIVTNIQREGSWEGYDLGGIQQICDLSSVPVIANGGAVNQADVDEVFKLSVDAGVSSSVLFLKNQSGVLVNFPFTQRKQLGLTFDE